MTDECQPPSSAELKAKYIEAADNGKWDHCRHFCNVAGCGGPPGPGRIDFTDAERAMWSELYELACSPSRDRDWPKHRAELV